MNDIYTAIDLRKSRRKYLDIPIPEDVIDEINKEIAKVNEESSLSFSLDTNASSMFDRFKKSYGLLSGVNNVIILAGFASDEHLHEKLGYYGEILVLKLTMLNLGTCWVSGSFDRNDEIFKKLDSSLSVFGVITVGYVEEKLSSREKFIHGISHIVNKKKEKLYTCQTPNNDFLDGINSLAKAPTANNSLNFHVTENEGVISMSVPKDTSNGLCNLGIGKLHFELGYGKGKFELGNGGKLIIG